MEVLHEIDFGNGFVQVPEPSNFESAEVDVIFNKDKARASLANLTLVWKGDTAKKIFAVYESGKTGGKGVSHALPYRVKVCGSSLFFDLMLVLGHSSAKFSCDQVELPAWEAQGMDWFDKETQAYSFWHLYKNLQTGDLGKIAFTDFKKTPYVITAIPNYTQIISLSFQELMLLWQLKELILTFTENSTEIPADLGESAVPVAGTPHIIVTVLHVANLILRIAEVILYLILIAKFGKELQDNIIQRKKYKLCMREKDLWIKMCDFLKLNFVSSIYASGSKYENATWMPQKIVMPKFSQNILDNFIDSLFDRPENELNNPQSYGYFDGLFSEFVDIMERKYNAKVTIIAGTLHFEEIHVPIVPNPYQIPNTGPVGYTLNLPAPFRTNLSQLAPYYECLFRIDETERNTLHRYRGTSAAIQIISPYGITKYSGWGQGQIVDLGSALAKRKYYLTKIESFLDKVIQVLYDVVNIVIAPINAAIAVINGIISAINAVISIFGGNQIGSLNYIQNPINVNVFSSRIGWMELENDSFGQPKTFIGVNIGGDWELHPNTEANMSALSLLNDFHGFNLATRGNQYLLYDNNQSKFCCQDYLQIANSNKLQTPDGRNGELLGMKWKLKAEIAREIEYKIQETYLMGLSEKLIIDGTP